jgi:hypothetical protein
MIFKKKLPHDFSFNFVFFLCIFEEFKGDF